ncbi:hypothetical protein [Hymenobacter sp. GOD-10R]|nr:hypothetical protein [Hymenobacter sp. GOD-10R]WRQ31972.1 hypothetical protein SD425_29605 [Hymenobacter sp. GOD-10R]
MAADPCSEGGLFTHKAQVTLLDAPQHARSGKSSSPHCLIRH